MENNKTTAINTVLRELKGLGYFRIHDVSPEQDPHLLIEADGQKRNILLWVDVLDNSTTSSLSKPERKLLQRKASESDREPWLAIVNPVGNVSWEMVV
ncbi:MAG: hypothetical protein MUC87_00520 [Bacteroidia bacterium]|jgi:hypothetical protein|nr:hypothetical protein [Bacteroidia bacterium]